MPAEIRDPEPGGFKRWLERKRDEERAAEAPQETTMANTDPAGSRQRVVTFFQTMAADPAREWGAEEAAAQMGSTVSATRQVLLRAAKAGKVERASRGCYRWAGGDAPEPKARKAKTPEPAPDLARLRWLAEGFAAGHTTAESVAEYVAGMFDLEVTP